MSNIRKLFLLSVVSTIAISSSQEVFAQADVQARALSLISNFAGEEIVLQSSDYSFDTRFGKVKVKLNKSIDGNTNAALVLTPPLEGETGKMSDQAMTLVSTLADSIGAEDNQATVGAISGVLQNGVGDSDGAEGDVSLNVSIGKKDESGTTNVSIVFKGDDKVVEAQLKVSENAGNGNASVTGESKVNNGTSQNVDVNVSQAGAITGTIGNTNVSGNATVNVGAKLESTTTTSTKKDGSSSSVTHTNNKDGTVTSTEVSKDSNGNVTNVNTHVQMGQVEIGKGTSAGSGNQSGIQSNNNIILNTEQGSSSGDSSSAAQDANSSSAQGNTTDSSNDNTSDIPDSTIVSSSTDYSGKNISYTNLSNGNYENVKFNSTIAIEADFQNSNLSGADFTNANLNGANLYGAKLNNATFTGAQIANANLSGATSNGFTAEQFYSTIDYEIGFINGINFSNNDLTGWTFAGSSLFNSSLENSNLTGADFRGTEFIGTNLTNVNFTDAQIANANLSGATSNGLTAEQFASTADYKSGTITGVNLSNNDLTGWSFKNMTLTNTSFANSTSNLLHFEGATMNDVDMSGITVKTLANFNENAVINGLKLDNSTFIDPSYVGGYRLAFSTSTIDNLSMRNANVHLDAIPTTGNNGTASAIYFTESTINSADFTGSTITGNITGNIENTSTAMGISAKESTINTLNLNSAKISANSVNENSSALAIGIIVSDSVIDNNGDGLTAENAEIQVTATSENGTATAMGFNGTNLTVNDSAVINLNGLKANVEATGKDKAITRVINLENASIAGSISTENMDITATATATDSTAQAYGAYASGANFSGDLSISGSAITATASSNGLAQGRGIFLNDAELQNASIDVGTIEISATSTGSSAAAAASGVYAEGAKFSGNLSISGSAITATASSNAYALGYGINLYRAELQNASIDVETIETSVISTGSSAAYAYGAYASGAKFSGDLSISGSKITATATASSSADGYGINLDGAELQNATIDVGTIETSATSTTHTYTAYAYGVSAKRAKFSGYLSISGSKITTTASSSSHAFGYGIYLNGAELQNATIDVGTIETSATSTTYTYTAKAYGVSAERAKFSGYLSISGSKITTTSSSSDSAYGYGIDLYGAELKNVTIDVDTISATSTGSFYAYAHGVDAIGANFSGDLSISGSAITSTASSSDSAYGYGINLASAELKNASIDVETIETSATSTGSSPAYAYGINLASAELKNATIDVGTIETSATSTGSSYARAFGVDAEGAKLSGDLSISGSAITATASSNGLAQGYGINLASAELQNATIDVETIETSATSTGSYYVEANAVNAFGAKLSGDLSIIGSAIKTTANSNVDADVRGIMIGRSNSNSVFQNVIIDVETIETSATSTVTLLDSSYDITAYGVSGYGIKVNGDLSIKGATITTTVTSNGYARGYGIDLQGATIDGNLDLSNSTIIVNINNVSDLYRSAGLLLTGTTVGLNANFQNMHFEIIKNGVDITSTDAIQFSNTLINGADFRGSNVSNENLAQATAGKNIIRSDGSILNFSMDSADDSWNVLSHSLSAKISLENESISNSTLTLLESAQLQITNGKSLTLGDNGVLEININPLESSVVPLIVDEGSQFIVDGGDIVVNMTEESPSHTFTIISWADSCDMSTLEQYLDSGKLSLLLNGQTFADVWSYIFGSNSLSITISSTVVPEPAEWAMLLGLFALGFAVYRRRK